MAELKQILKDLETTINSNSLENGSNTPDFILACYLHDCLQAFNRATLDRERWYGREVREVVSTSVVEDTTTTQRAT